MERFSHYIGIDISDADFYCSLMTSPDKPLVGCVPFENTPDGFEALHVWLCSHGVAPGDAVICMEATGVYAEALCYWLDAKGYRLSVEPPLKIKRAFYPIGHKNDRVDSKQIAEYAYRFQDKLRFWKPREHIVEQVAILLTTREQLVKQRTASQNALTALGRKVVKNQFAATLYRENIKQLKDQIKQIEKEIWRLIRLNPFFKKIVKLIIAIPGAALLLAANMLVITEGFTRCLEYKKLAAMIGVCPYQHRSGSSVWKRDRSAHFGPARLRKLLHLAARSVTTHKEQFINYSTRKAAEGKTKKIIFNNVVNKLLRVICVVIKEQREYNPEFISEKAKKS